MTKKYFCILSFFLFGILSSNAQSNAFLKHIDKLEFAKAEKKLSKKYEKEKDDIELNYAYAKLYNSKEYKGYNPYKAYEYNVIAIKVFNDLGNEEKVKYSKKGYTIESLSKIKEECYNLAYNDCKDKNTIDCFKNYILYFTNALEWKIKAQRAIYDIGFNIAEKINTLDSYQKFINDFNSLKLIDNYFQSDDLLKSAWRNVYALEFAKSKELNSIRSYQEYIDKYPKSHLFNDAVSLRNMLAFSEAIRINTIDSYQYFINKYPEAVEKKEAIQKRDELAFNDAKKMNNSDAFKKFILKYPNSSFLSEAIIKFDNLLFQDVVKTNSIKDYWVAIKEHPNNKNRKNIQDSLLAIIKNEGLITEMDRFIEVIGINSAEKNIDDYLDVLFQDGDINTYTKMYNKHLKIFSANYKTKIENEFESLKKLDDLNIDIGVRQFNTVLYENFIKNNAPKEIAFVCVQKLAERFIMLRDWSNASSIFKKYKPYFPDMSLRFDKIIGVLEKNEKQIIFESLAQINSQFDDYSPVISYDFKKLYFCSKGRPDGLGGEDIYTSDWINGKWSSLELLTDLSTADGNEAPMAISADGNILLLWRNDNGGDIYYSLKTQYGWSEPVVFPYPINTEYYEGDASFTADGKGLLFTSARPGGLNVYTNNPGLYRGDNEYPTDIFYSEKLKGNNWSTPINLGNQINTPYTERSPFLHPDGRTLYFSSDGHYGIGKTDVFMTQRLNDSSWTHWAPPINMGKNINTVNKDWGFKFSTDGEYAFYSANKKKVELSSLVLILDISGSMSGSRLEALKVAALEACKTAISNFSEVAILTFPGYNNSLIFDRIDFTEDYKQLEQFILNLRANGGTPMYDAILEANKYMSAHKHRASKNQMVILMSDGDANGNMSFDMFLKTISQLSISKIPHQCIALEVNEYSQAYSDLAQIATMSGGNFYHSKTSADLKNAFAEATTSLYDLTLAKGTGKDIFSFKIPDYLKPDYVATISGKLVNKSNKPISATISWEDLETNKIIGESNSNPFDGSFYIILPLGKIYGYYIDNNELFPISNNIDLRKETKSTSIEQNIDVVTFKEMIEQGTAVPINNLFFNFGAAGLLDESLPELKRVANIIIKNGLKVEISGHTDDIGTEKQNQILSETRANNVKDYLIKQGCDPAIFTIIGYGATRNIADNSTDEGRKKNRRVELRFLK
jgi:outer membrane protein OmpA-like peptidoglycan-associated protein/uncharacterized protein YegL